MSEQRAAKQSERWLGEEFQPILRTIADEGGAARSVVVMVGIDETGQPDNIDLAGVMPPQNAILEVWQEHHGGMMPATPEEWVDYRTLRQNTSDYYNQLVTQGHCEVTTADRQYIRQDAAARALMLAGVGLTGPRKRLYVQKGGIDEQHTR